MTNQYGLQPLCVLIMIMVTIIINKHHGLPTSFMSNHSVDHIQPLLIRFCGSEIAPFRSCFSTTKSLSSSNVQTFVLATVLPVNTIKVVSLYQGVAFECSAARNCFSFGSTPVDFCSCTFATMVAIWEVGPPPAYEWDFFRGLEMLRGASGCY